MSSVLIDKSTKYGSGRAILYFNRAAFSGRGLRAAAGPRVILICLQLCKLPSAKCLRALRKVLNKGQNIVPQSTIARGLLLLYGIEY